MIKIDSLYKFFMNYFEENWINVLFVFGMLKLCV